MKGSRILWMGVVAAVLGVSGWVRAATPPPASADRESVRVGEESTLGTHTVWSGTVHVVRPLVVPRNGSLTLRPGAHVVFEIPEPEHERDRRPWRRVHGRLSARGTAEEPIVFTSVPARKSEWDDMIQLEEAEEAALSYCVFEHGPWAVHIHQTPVEITNCVFRDNYGGVRFQGDPVSLRGNSFADNRIGIRCLRAAPVIEENGFTGNLTGVFFREEVVGATVRRNNFDNREYDVKLGESQIQDVDAGMNWWASVRPEDKIFDGRNSAGIGFVATDPVLSAPWRSESRP